MMGQHKSDPQLFNYAVNLEKRVRAAHPLRRVKATIDFGFVREEVAHCYGKNGNESVAPEVILKMQNYELGCSPRRIRPLAEKKEGRKKEGEVRCLL